MGSEGMRVSGDDDGGEEEAHELAEEEELEVETVLDLDGIGDGDGLVLVVLELEGEEVQLHLQQVVDQHQDHHPRPFLFQPLPHPVQQAFLDSLNGLPR
jgi:hypothetical protein